MAERVRKKHIIDYVKQFEHIPVFPIWDGEKDFCFMCLSIPDFAEAMGLKVIRNNDHAEVVGCQITNEEELLAFIEKDYCEESILQRDVNNLRWMMWGCPDQPCGGGCYGPFSIAHGILGDSIFFDWVIRKPQLMIRLVDYLTKYVIQLAKMESAAGQEFFWMADPMAALVSPENFWKFSGKYLKRIYREAGVPGFLHVCGDTLKLSGYFSKTGVELLSIDNVTDIGQCIRMVGPKVVVMGNVDPVILRYGTPDDVRKEVREILDKCEGFPNFVLGSGCAILPGTPQENVEVLIEMARET